MKKYVVKRNPQNYKEVNKVFIALNGMPYSRDGTRSYPGQKYDYIHHPSSKNRTVHHYVNQGYTEVSIEEFKILVKNNFKPMETFDSKNWWIEVDTAEKFNEVVDYIAGPVTNRYWTDKDCNNGFYGGSRYIKSYDNGQRFTYQSTPFSQHRNEITWEQFQSIKRGETVQDTKRKIIGYFSPYDTWGGNVPEGTKFMATSSAPTPAPVFVAVFESGLIKNAKYELPLEVVKDWKPIYQSVYKVGDVVKCISGESQTYRGAGWVLGKVFKVDRITMDTSRNLQILWPATGSSGIFEDSVRHLTEEELKEHTSKSVSIKYMDEGREGNLQVEVKKGKMEWSSHTISEREIEKLRVLLGTWFNVAGYSFKPSHFEIGCKKKISRDDLITLLSEYDKLQNT